MPKLPTPGMRFEYIGPAFYLGKGTVVDVKPTPNAAGKMGYTVYITLDCGFDARSKDYPNDVVRTPLSSFRKQTDWGEDDA